MREGREDGWMDGWMIKALRYCARYCIVPIKVSQDRLNVFIGY